MDRAMNDMPHPETYRVDPHLVAAEMLAKARLVALARHRLEREGAVAAGRPRPRSRGGRGAAGCRPSEAVGGAGFEPATSRL
jgi:hypothetical protein